MVEPLAFNITTITLITIIAIITIINTQIVQILQNNAIEEKGENARLVG